MTAVCIWLSSDKRDLESCDNICKFFSPSLWETTQRPRPANRDSEEVFPLVLIKTKT